MMALVVHFSFGANLLHVGIVEAALVVLVEATEEEEAMEVGVEAGVEAAVD